MQVDELAGTQQAGHEASRFSQQQQQGGEAAAGLEQRQGAVAAAAPTSQVEVLEARQGKDGCGDGTTRHWVEHDSAQARRQAAHSPEIEVLAGIGCQ